MNRAANTLELLRRASFARLFALLFVLITSVHWRCLQDPPYWDALMGAFAQGHWLATHSFSPIALLRDGGRFQDGGACVYAFNAYPWITGAFEEIGLAPASTFAVLHLVSFAAAAAIVAELFRLVRDEAGAGLAALLSLALLVQPMFRALACQMNMDVLLAACTLFSIGAVSRGRYRAASVWSVVAFFTKPTAVILVVSNLAALVLRGVRPAWFGIDRDRESATTRKRRLEGLVVHAVLFACFVLELVVAARFGKSAEGITLFGGLVPFLTRRLWTLPEFGIALALFLFLVPWIAVRAARKRASALEIDLALFLLAFVGFFCQYVNVLPRYFLQAWPVLLAALSLAALRAHVPRRAIAALLFVFGAFAIVNSHGRFHPTHWADWNDPRTGQPLVSNDGWLLERSMEYRDDLLLDQELCARLQARTGQVVIADWPLLHALAVPEFGYVLMPPRLASANTPIRFASVPIARVEDIEPGMQTVRVLSPNVYDTETSRVLVGDEVLQVLESGRLRAFLVRRPRDSDGGRR